MTEFSYTELLEEAEREVTMRFEVYSRSASGGELRPLQKRRIAMMEAIAAHFRALAEKERLL